MGEIRKMNFTKNNFQVSVFSKLEQDRLVFVLNSISTIRWDALFDVTMHRSHVFLSSGDAIWRFTMENEDGLNQTS